MDRQESASSKKRQMPRRPKNCDHVVRGCGKSVLGMVISSEAIERGFNVRFRGLSELVERLSKAEKNLRR